jgi:flagellar assembly protein FliH
MTARAKFMFDADFGSGAAARTPAAVTAALAEAEARGYRNGLAAAEAQVRTEAERRSAAAFERIAVVLTDLAARLQEVEHRLETEAIEVAMAVARKLAPALIAEQPFSEISALAARCFAEHIAAPHVAVRVNDHLYPLARERLESLAAARGFTGRVVVLGEPDIAPGDCRIEWAEGGLNRHRAATEAAIAEVVDRYVSARLGEPNVRKALEG